MAQYLRGRILFIAVIAMTGLLCVQGCSRKQQGQDTGVSLVEKKKAEKEKKEEEAQKEAEKKKQPEKQKMDEQQKQKKQMLKKARKQLSEKDVDEALQSIKQMGNFYTSREAVLSRPAKAILSDVALNADTSTLRGAAVKQLAARADEAVDTLVRAVEDPSTKVRNAAIAALGNGSKGSRAEAKLEQLAQSPNDEVNSLATDSLQALRMGGGAADIIAAVSKLGQPEGDASAQAAIELNMIGDKALPYLKEAIYESKNPRKRHAATMCVALICAGTNPSLQEFAKQWQSIHKGELRADKANPDGLPILLHALNDPFPMTRAIAAQGLGYLGSKRAARPLADALQDDDVHVRRRAALALVTTPAESVKKDVARAALYDDDERVRRYAIEALGFIGSDFVTKALIQAADDESPLVRRYTAKQLGQTGDPAALEALISTYKDARRRAWETDDMEKKAAEQDVRWAAVQAVAKLRDPRGIDILMTALDDPVPQVATAAEMGLQKLGVARRRVPGLE